MNERTSVNKKLLLLFSIVLLCHCGCCVHCELHLKSEAICSEMSLKQRIKRKSNLGFSGIHYRYLFPLGMLCNKRVDLSKNHLKSTVTDAMSRITVVRRWSAVKRISDYRNVKNTMIRCHELIIILQ